MAEVITHVTPDPCAIAAETLQELRVFARTLGSHGPACLQGRLDMMTVADSAVQTQGSVATVERTRHALRQHAKTLISMPP